MSTRQILMVSFGLLVLCEEVCAAKFSSQRGFSCEYPDGWTILSASQCRETVEALRPHVEDMDKLDENSIAMAVANTQPDEFQENITVAVFPGSLPISDERGRQYFNVLERQSLSMGLEVRNLQVEQNEFAGRRVLSATCDVTVPGESEPVRQWQVLMPGRRQTYIVTCAARACDFESFRPAFAKTIESMQIDTRGGGFLQSLPPAVRLLIVIGLVSLLARVFK